MTKAMDATAYQDLEISSDQPPKQLTLEVGPMAPGGHCIARHEGYVIFVRHAVPGETVVVQLIQPGPAGRYWWADTIKVLTPSEFRRTHQWKLADALRAHAAGRRPIGEASLGHVVLEHQRRLKALAFRSAMTRIGEQSFDDAEISVTGIEADEPAGLQWRTRNGFLVSDGRLAVPVNNSTTPVAIRNIPLAVPQLDKLQLWGLDFSGAARVEVATPVNGRQALISIYPAPPIAESDEIFQAHVGSWRQQVATLPQHVSAMVVTPSRLDQRPEINVLQGQNVLEEHVACPQWGTRTFQVSGAGYWHAHRDGPATLVDAVMRAADVQPGQVIADLYAGAGLYSRYLAEATGPTGAVLSVDASPVASDTARHNLQDLPQVTVLNDKVNRILTSWLLIPEADVTEGGLNNRPVDTIVVHPSRVGIGKTVLKAIDQLRPDKIIYVSGNPVALARDTRVLSSCGWSLASTEAFDLAPETQRLDSVSVFRRPS
ncbi:TRAM domain-containing protein [Enteractinococcus fodinae]|uniref:tRNA/tmRNA/rRNA uracil-C5-methylase (TrmA/RlmC/RlmD family) n=1 Tax=Enteractinococcus fodinae TaxID=684663 RepID=A0ABU2B242_9MICC|nr:TRAM domain-containing protein [Enteractinococcus fodinae]MDR7346848.1 tRNA/tmRNA/rRNA uracil-C5-methylase (TrmA/RlmC/RlmD family) [Enteractinococcus fodinae]